MAHTNETMRAAVLVEPGHFAIEERPRPEPGPGEVLLAMEGSGVCASDIPPFEGRDWFEYPFEPGAPGHEGWGVVEAVGEDVDGLAEGDRVAALTYHAYASHDVAEAADCVKLPEAIEKTPFPGEPIGCALNVFERAQIEPGQVVALIGAGFLGNLICALCAEADARVVAISRRETSRTFAERFGAWKTLPLDDHDAVVERITEWTGGDLCERTIECVGKQGPLDLATRLTGVRGRLVVAGYHQDGVRRVDMQTWNWRGLDVINAHERDQAIYVRGMRRAVEAIEAGRIDPTPLFTHRFALDEIDEAFEAARAREEGFMKALIEPN
ncbi:MAG: MDR/zinc-dependent alcohol dehydrogenase-like family protein [Persicimonas sp.]